MFFYLILRISMRLLKARGGLIKRLKIHEDICFNLLKPNGNSVYHAVIHIQNIVVLVVYL
jgi:hypothetical protein